MKLTTALALALVLPGVALAQDGTKPADDKPATAPSSTASPSPNSSSAAAVANSGFKQADTAEGKPEFISAQPNDMMTSRLVGISVYNNAGESVGSIEDLIVLDGKSIHAVIIGVGGFLGIGERYVAVSPASIALKKENDRMRAVLNTTKDELKSAEPFQYNKKS